MSSSGWPTRVHGWACAPVGIHALTQHTVGTPAADHKAGQLLEPYISGSAPTAPLSAMFLMLIQGVLCQPPVFPDSMRDSLDFPKHSQQRELSRVHTGIEAAYIYIRTLSSPRPCFTHL